MQLECTDDQYHGLHRMADKKGEIVKVSRMALAALLRDHAALHQAASVIRPLTPLKRNLPGGSPLPASRG